LCANLTRMFGFNFPGKKNSLFVRSVFFSLG
jgi:hypothetical protein